MSNATAIPDQIRALEERVIELERKGEADHKAILEMLGYLGKMEARLLISAL